MGSSMKDPMELKVIRNNSSTSLLWQCLRVVEKSIKTCIVVMVLLITLSLGESLFNFLFDQVILISIIYDEILSFCVILHRGFFYFLIFFGEENGHGLFEFLLHVANELLNRG